MTQDGLTNGENLRKRRTRLRLTQAQLAERIGTTQQTIDRWERGAIAIQNARMLFRALNDVADELAAETDPLARFERNQRMLRLMESEMAGS